ncbi:Putative WD40/YVTN repeat-like-containing domain superfamily [Septoria linicola]|uniref:WD40/YVTN repeat-like-containing domain superfamily n=1 Tax=Septoria linicola TaxID=215465 RepID=A0A9Q9EDW4_9PEZI|nr:putative WD40/YVTN repeat-like-containing domain superfamily [Septoria linicola]USW48151.1 Putative WD40/YVTN repeat-like-containing domain superfamily [Septoria linicola]
MPGGGPLLETNNTLEKPTGPEYQLVLGEGTYVLKDDLHLATPPPHPSDAPQPNNNPLATTTGPPTSGVKLSIAVLEPRRPPSQNLFRAITSQSTRSAVPPSIQEEVHSPKSDAGSTANGFGSPAYYGHASTFGDDNPALAVPVASKGKKDQKAKPKNNIVKSNSSYVSRVIPHESLQKRLSDRAADGMFAFANVNRAFMWLDLSSAIKTENMTKVLFTKAHALCHDVNAVTRSASHLDIVLGFNTSDIIWYEPMSQKYARLNKNGMINPAPVAAIRWLPNKENLFLAAHTDGTLVVYDKEKEDAEFVPEENAIPETQEGQERSVLRIQKSVQSRNQKANPVAAWRVSNMKINDIAFSPDGQLLATVSDDGCLTIIDFINERVVDVHRAYYGALLCVTWSPDGRYVLSGGQDDLVSIWSLAERALVARCVGHHSWVTDVKFDPWRCDERNYRFGSVGEDCRLLLWDFSVGMLGRPKTMRQRGSISSHLPGERKQSTTTVGRFRSSSNLTQVPTAESTDDGEIVHAVDAKASTAVLPPVMSKSIDEHPLCWLGFEADSIVTSCKDGHIREWMRPTDGP